MKINGILILKNKNLKINNINTLILAINKTQDC